MKKEKVKQVHHYVITSPKSDKARWQTFVPDEINGRKKVSATTEERLYEKLYEFYFNRESVTLKSLYSVWKEKRISENVNARTIRRNQNHWDKYYEKNKIASIPVTKLTADDIEKFFHQTIKQYSLTIKELNNMKFILKDILVMAKRKKYILENPFLEVCVNKNGCRPQSNLKDVSRVYLPEEKEKLFKALNEELVNCPENTDSYAILLLFKLGLRIGEVCALKFEDIDYQNFEVHIHRMETQDLDANEKMHPVVVEYTKKKSPFGDRYLPIGEYEVSILEKVKRINEAYGYSDNDFIFCDEKGRTKIREIDNRIRKLCNKADIEVKSAHDIRRTVASELYNVGNVPVEIIRDYLGHSDIKTTWSYILNNQKKKETNKMILDSLSGLNGLMRTQTEKKKKALETA